MHRKGAVREAVAVIRVHDGDEATRHVDETDGERCGHRHVRTDLDRAVSDDAEACTAVHRPGRDGVTSAVERVLRQGDAPAMPSQSRRRRTIERSAGRRIGQSFASTFRQQLGEICITGATKPNRHQRLLPQIAEARPGRPNLRSHRH